MPAPKAAGPFPHPVGPLRSYITSDGYVRLRQNYRVGPYQRGRRMTEVMEHVLVMERHLGRPLEPWERVHHRDGDRSHNELSNLELLHVSTHPPGQSVTDLHSMLDELAASLKRVERERDHWRGVALSRIRSATTVNA